MTETSQPPSAALGLSARVLVLVVLFVMIAEVLIYVPSISRFRKVWLEDKVEEANIAVLAAQASPEERVGPGLAMELLEQTGAFAIALKMPDRRMLMLSKDMPPAVDVTIDISATSFMVWIGGAAETLLHRRGRVMMVHAPAPSHGEDAKLEVLLDEEPLRDAMLAYSQRILQLSIIISLITAGLVFLSLRWLLIRPIRRITVSLMRFRVNPDDESVPLRPSRRRDEIGIAQRELLAMQTDLRAALRQKSRLAAVGAGVARINHDLRNILATAMLTSDRLSAIADPEVQRLAPRLVAAIDRASTLCQRTLEFARGAVETLRPTAFRLADVVSEVNATIGMMSGPLRGREAPGEEISGDAAAGGGVGFASVIDAGGDMAVEADREQVFRVLSNLILNARQAGARSVRISAAPEGDRVVVEVTDDGPGIPEAVWPRLFEPFAAARRNGGSGLGLAIAREIVHAHGGDLVIAATGPAGTTFRFDLPAARRRRQREAA